jgi:hypothetical protein
VNRKQRRAAKRRIRLESTAFYWIEVPKGTVLKARKYFKGRVYAGERMQPYVVWDGWRDYRNHPPPQLMDAEGLTGKVIVAQVHDPSVGVEFVSDALRSCDSLVVWARDHEVYQSIVKNLREQSHATLQ